MISTSPSSRGGSGASTARLTTTCSMSTSSCSIGSSMTSTRSFTTLRTLTTPVSTTLRAPLASSRATGMTTECLSSLATGSSGLRMGVAKQARCRDRAKRGSALQLHRRADGPRRELVVAVAEGSGFRPFARRGLQDELEKSRSRLRHRLAAIDHRAAVEVHVLFLVNEERRIRRELERRRRLAAIGGAAPGCEADHVGAAGHLAGSRYRVVARR